MHRFAGTRTWDPATDNPLWKAYLQSQPASSDARGPLLARYAHTLSNPATIAFMYRWTLVGVKGVVSIGAGTGYWEWVLAQMSIPVAAFDLAPPNLRPNEYHYTSPVFHPVQVGGPEQAAQFPDFALFLGWPPPGPLAYQALRAYTGRRFIYMGVPEWNGDQAFFRELIANWQLIAVHKPVRWPGIPDVIYVFERRP